VRTQTSISRRLARPLALAIAGTLLMLPAGPASANSGGTGPGGGGGGNNSQGCTARDDAQLNNGKATIPCSAPTRVAKVIRAANEIAKGKGYCYGGGHQSFKDNCYDCSGAVSYALHGGNFVKSPMPSSGYYNWGSKGKGNWITVFTKDSHMYAKIAGLRWDTSNTAGAGPGWAKSNASTAGFKVRHKGSF
jgi:hypothetical protein